MPSPIPITSADDPRIAFYREMRGNHPRLVESGYVLVEGLQQIAKLLESELPLHSILLESQHLPAFSEALERRLLPSAEFYLADRSVMSELIGYRFHSGALALCTPKAPIGWEALRPPIVALNGLVDTENVGSIVRSCAAFGIRSLLLDSQTAHPLLRRSVRVSMGGALFMDVCQVPELVPVLELLRARCSIIGVEKCLGSAALSEFRFPKNCVLILGKEREGIAKEVLEVCDQTVCIGMDSRLVASLNVSAAAAVTLARLFEQRALENAGVL